MPQLLKPQSTKVVTKEGECLVSIALELTINLKTEEGIKASITASSAGREQQGQEDRGWVVQDFTPRKKVKFGKSIEE